MITREQRYNELYNSGLVNAIKTLFANRNDISEDYYVLMADYIDSMDQVKDEMLINPTEIAKKLPQLVNSIQEADLGGIHGITDDNRIQMNQTLNYEEKKLYFFHELTHAIQTTHENGLELCGFYDGHDGMFLTEGATQYTAEMLYNVSNGTNLQHREQPRTVRGATNRTPYSPLSEYQYNGDILELLAKSMDLPLPQVLSLSYKPNGRETLKELYESMDGNEGQFDELMNNLEQIYSIDNLLIRGYSEELQSSSPINIVMQDGTTQFKGNLSIYRQLMDKTERKLVTSFILNHDTEHVLKNYKEIANLITTSEIKDSFLSTVQQLSQEMPRQSDEEYSSQQIENKVSLKQKIALFLHKNSVLMKIPFIEKYVNKNIMQLPSATIKYTQYGYRQTHRDFINLISNNGKCKNLSKEQIKQQRAIISQIEQNLNRLDKIDKQNNNDERF